MNSKHERKVVKVGYEVEDVEGLQKKLDDLKRWYNDHWYIDKDVMVKQAKNYVCDHLKITFAEQEKI